MLLPQGELIGVEVGNPFKVKPPKNGYIIVSWGGGSARGVIIFKDGKPIKCYVEQFEDGSKVEGSEAEKILRNVDNAVIEKYKADVDVEEREESEVSEEQYLHEVVFGRDWGGFTGVVECDGGDRRGVVQFIDGKIAGVVIELDGDKFEGESALFYADQIRGKVTVREGEVLFDQGFRKLPMLQTPEFDEEELKRKIKEAEKEIGEILKKIKKEL